jgi:TonB family protein
MSSMRISWAGRSSSVLATIALAATMVSARQSSVEDINRKVKFKTNPQFSDLARRLNLSGKVKIELAIAPDGHVKSSRAIGGHPILVQSCLEAVRTWKFEAFPEETTQVIEFDFKQ